MERKKARMEHSTPLKVDAKERGGGERTVALREEETRERETL